MADFKKLVVWQRGRALTLAIYEATGQFPTSERSGLTSQLRRAAASIPSNIAEGAARHGGRDQARCYRIALGSARELENHLLLSTDLGMLPRPAQLRLLSDLDEIERMLMGLIRAAVRVAGQKGRPLNSKLSTRNSKLSTPDSQLIK